MFKAIYIHSYPTLVTGELDKVYTKHEKTVPAVEVHRWVIPISYVTFNEQICLAEKPCEAYRAYGQYYPRIKIWMRIW